MAEAEVSKNTSKNFIRSGKPKAPSTQRYIPIKAIREDCVILRDGTLRAVILTSSINFALKSEDEQNAVIAAYVSFLNSIDFPLQIVIQSRKLDIDEYIERLKKVEKEQVNELLKMQTKEYITYIQELIKLGDIMNKRFYVVVPYDPARNRAKGFWLRLQELFWPQPALTLSDKRFHERREELDKRIDFVMNNLASIGLQSVRLETQSLIELYYNSYNPAIYEAQELTDINKINIETD